MPKKLTKHKRAYKRNKTRRLAKGQANIGILIVLLLVFLIFLTAMFLPKSSNVTKGTAVDQSVPVPTQYLEQYRGGMEALGITPLPSTYSPIMCKPITNDLVLLIDNSGSMKGQKLVQAKEAAKLFVQLISINPESRVSVVSFNKSASLLSPLTSDTTTITSGIDRLTEGSNTCIQCGVMMGAAQFIGSASADIKRSVVLLSDGKANYLDTGKANESAAKAAAQRAITANYSFNNASYYTIAIGDDADEGFMSQAAASTNGAAFSAASFDVLSQTFATVATDICNDSEYSDEY